MWRYSLFFTAWMSQMSQQNDEPWLHPVDLEDPETLVEWSTPPNPSYEGRNWWAEYNENADHMGLSFSGKREFPWLVDVRVSGQDQETWAVGNIVSATHVVTNCRTMKHFEKLHLSSEVKVTFCMQSLDEPQLYGEPKAGTRWVDNVQLHSSCERDELGSDLAVLNLDRMIRTLPPYIGYMPFAYDRTSMGIPQVHLENMIAQRLMCFVASFGRNYTNKQNHLVLDYKVKYRVYYYDWKNCSSRAKVFCPTEENTCMDGLRRTADNRLVCMRTRALVGTVCDHDRGAPVVCDEEVFGFVTRGAPYAHCNNRLPVPFIAVKLHFVAHFLRPYLSFPRGGGNKKTSKAPKVVGCALLMVSLLHVFYFTNQQY